MHKPCQMSNYLFYLLVFLFPLGARKIFFTDQSFFYGYHSFYNTFYIYLTDILVLCLIITWILEKVKISRGTFTFQSLKKVLRAKIFSDKIYTFLVFFGLFIIFSVLLSREKTLGFYGFVKFFEFSLLFAYARENFFRTGTISRESLLFFWLILAILCFEAILGTAQYFTQSSLGLKILGEEYLRPGLGGIAEFPSFGLINNSLSDFFGLFKPISGETINIRAYGTFPHPNIFGGMLFIGMIINLFLFYVSRERFLKIILSCSLFLLIFGLVVTFSRGAWVVSFLGVCFWVGLLFWKSRKYAFSQMQAIHKTSEPASYFPGRIAFLMLLLIVFLGLVFWVFQPQILDRTLYNQKQLQTIEAQPESIVNRLTFNEIAGRMLVQNPLSGVGEKNFVVRMDEYAGERLLPWLHQPVHNIFLLIGAEVGFLGLLVLLVFLYNIVRRVLDSPFSIEKLTLFIICSGILLISLFDHYFWTIQQGSLMFWVFFGLLAAISKTKKTADAPSSHEFVP